MATKDVDMSTEPTRPHGSCPECGAVVNGGRAACQQLFDEVLAREFGDYRYSREHRLTVDVYSLQHPAEYMRSAKSTWDAWRGYHNLAKQWVVEATSK